MSGSSAYSAGFRELTPRRFVGRRAPGRPARGLALILDQPLYSTFLLASGLQNAGKLSVVEDRHGRGLEAEVATMELPLAADHVAYIRTQEIVNPDDTVGFVPDALVVADPAQASPASAGGAGLKDTALGKAIDLAHGRMPSERPTLKKSSRPAIDETEEPYVHMDFGNPDLRLLALFRLWNVIDLFYPYRDLLDAPWRSVLTRYIPRMESGHTRLDYERTLLELSAELHDSHVGVFPTPALFESLGGAALPPVSLRIVEGKAVVVQTRGAQSGLAAGAVIETIDGEPFQQRLDRFRPLVSESTPQGYFRPASRLFLYALAGPQDSIVRFGVRDSHGLHEVPLKRSESYHRVELRDSPAVQRLTPTVGYIDVTRIEAGRLDSAVDELLDTSALIIDMRGYPRDDATGIGRRLGDLSGDIHYAQDRLPMVAGNDPPELVDYQQQFEADARHPYHGRRLVLINEDAFSQSEQISMMLEAGSKRTTFIGSPTTGANGNVTQMSLPGGYQMTFTGMSVRHADGRPLQRVGIQPAVHVAPTIRGIRSGHDEILDAALKLVRGGRGR